MSGRLRITSEETGRILAAAERDPSLTRAKETLEVESPKDWQVPAASRAIVCACHLGEVCDGTSFEQACFHIVRHAIADGENDLRNRCTDTQLERTLTPAIWEFLRWAVAADELATRSLDVEDVRLEVHKKLSSIKLPAGHSPIGRIAKLRSVDDKAAQLAELMPEPAALVFAVAEELQESVDGPGFQIPKGDSTAQALRMPTKRLGRAIDYLVSQRIFEVLDDSYDWKAGKAQTLGLSTTVDSWLNQNRVRSK